MTEKDILNKLLKKYPKQVTDIFPFPKVHHGKGEIKCIILGADPTHLVENKPKPLQMVFGLNNEKSPYWNTIKRNIKHLENITMDNIYVQNLCRNYFTIETSRNKSWAEIAKNYWVHFLKIELDNLFEPEIPVFMTTEFILNSVLINQKPYKAFDIYSKLISFSKAENLLSRELIAFYRHQNYALKNWNLYTKFIKGKLELATPNRMTFKYQISNYALGFLDEQSIPKIGIAALNEGIESENLRIIAGMSSTNNTFKLKEYLLAALDENNIYLPSKKEALKTILSPIINKILSNKIDIIIGCLEITKIVNRTKFEWSDLGLLSIYIALIEVGENDLQIISSEETKREIFKELENYKNST